MKKKKFVNDFDKNLFNTAKIENKDEKKPSKENGLLWKYVFISKMIAFRHFW